MFQKFKLKFNNKAYLQIDLAFGLFIFLILFIFVYNFYAHYKSDLIVNNEILQLQTEADNLCYMLINSQGGPDNWESDVNSTKYFGLRNLASHELNSNKVIALAGANYFVVLDKLNISGNIGIEILGLDTNTNYVDFGIFAENINPKYANSQCFSNYNSEIVKVFVEVWK